MTPSGQPERVPLRVPADAEPGGLNAACSSGMSRNVKFLSPTVKRRRGDPISFRGRDFVNPDSKKSNTGALDTTLVQMASSQKPLTRADGRFDAVGRVA